MVLTETGLGKLCDSLLTTGARRVGGRGGAVGSCLGGIIAMLVNLPILLEAVAKAEAD